MDVQHLNKSSTGVQINGGRLKQQKGNGDRLLNSEMFH